MQPEDFVHSRTSASESSSSVDDSISIQLPTKLSEERKRACSEDLHGKTMSAYLRNKHRVQLGPRQCRRLLREWEFRYRKPRPVIARSDPLKQAAHKKTPPPGQR